MAESDRADQPMQAFLRRVWREDVQPLLRGRHASQRASAARYLGKAAGLGGGLVDKALGTRGRPFTRFLTVLGSTFGALLPDVWDWEWLRGADARQRRHVEEQVSRRAAELQESEALLLLGLRPDATSTEARERWRELARRWHPDKATEDAQRAEHQVRFIAYRQGYDALCRIRRWNDRQVD